MNVQPQRGASKSVNALVAVTSALLAATFAWSVVAQAELAEVLGDVAHCIEDIEIWTVDLGPNRPYWLSPYKARMAAASGSCDGTLLISTGRFEDGGLRMTNFCDSHHSEYQYPDVAYVRCTVRFPAEGTPCLVSTAQFITTELTAFGWERQTSAL